MRDFMTIVFDVCRHFLLENQAVLTEEDFAKIHGWIRSKSIPQLASCSTILPFAYQADRDRLRVLLQVEAFFKKNVLFTDEETCQATAYASFYKSEVTCRIANKRLDHYLLNESRMNADLRREIGRARSYVSRVLGDFSVFLEAIPEHVRMTSGASAQRPRRTSQAPVKVKRKPFVSGSCAPYYDALSRHRGYGHTKPRLVRANRIEMVPKNYKTFRSIACEPEGNIPFQLAFDSFAKQRMRRVGIDLSDQCRNQDLAKRASIDNSLATIDLSAASDSLAYNAVYGLLPHAFAKYLDDVRSKHGMIEGRELKYAKFSSMGNGATFALETLVFASCCYAVGSKEFSVYGDDIIIEKELSARLVTILRFLGFAVNSEKSHFDGPFRESCGANCWEGVDITPFYVRELDKRKAVQSHFVNGLVKIAAPYGSLATYLLDLVSEWKLPAVPVNDNTLSGVFVDAVSAYGLRVVRNRRNRWTFQYKAFTPITRIIRLSREPSLFLWHNRRNSMCDEREGYFLDIEPSISATEYQMPTHKYARKWVDWVYPIKGIHASLYWWSDMLVTREGYFT